MDEESQSGVQWMRLEFVAAAALAISLTCLFVGQAAERFADQATPSPLEVAKLKPHFNAIDYATTSSIKGGGVVIGPCDTHSP